MIIRIKTGTFRRILHNQMFHKVPIERHNQTNVLQYHIHYLPHFEGHQILVRVYPLEKQDNHHQLNSLIEAKRIFKTKYKTKF